MSGTRDPRVTALQFGEAAGAVLGGVGVFGSEANGVIEYSVDPAVIQSLSVWLDGWSSAILGGGNPAVEDFNGAFFVFSYMLKYILRNGIPEWDSATEYFNGDFVKDVGVPPPGVAGAHAIYVCIVSSASSSVNETPASSPNSWRIINTSAGLNPQATTTLAARATGTWTGHVEDETIDFNCIAWSPELAILVTLGNTLVNDHQAMSSTNGTTWTKRTVVSGNTDTWNDVCWWPEKLIFIAVALAGTDQIVTSTNGTSWTARTPANANDWGAVCIADWLGLAISVSRHSVSGAQVQKSVDGVTWTTSAAAAALLWTTVFAAEELNLVVAVASSLVLAQVMTTTDGTTWTIGNSSVIGAWISGCWAKEIRTACVVSTDGKIMTSHDCVTWTTRTPAAANQFTKVFWARELGMFIALSTTGANRVQTSVDGGETWVAVAASAANGWNGGVWVPELGIAVAVAGSGVNRTMCSKYVRKFIT